MQSLQAQDSFSLNVSSGGNAGTELLTVEMAAQHSLLTLDTPMAMALTLNSPSSSSGFGLVVSFPDKKFDKKVKDIGTKYPPKKWPAGTATPTTVTDPNGGGAQSLPAFTPKTATKPASHTSGVVTVDGTTETIPVTSGIGGPSTHPTIPPIITTVKGNHPHIPGNPTQSATNSATRACITQLFEHAEGDAVSVCILTGKDVTIYINNPDICNCCRQAIPLLVPKGSTVTVIRPGKGGAADVSESFPGTR
jgi:hypothetical protein